MATPTTQAARPGRVAVNWRLVAGIFRRATVNFVEDRCTVLAAAISYFALFSLFPLTLLAAAVFGIVLRNNGVRDRVLDGIVEAIPINAPSVANSLRALADLGPTLSVVALIATLWTSSALASAVRAALDVVFDVEQPRPLLRAKLLDYLILLCVGALFLASIILTTWWRVAEVQADERWGLLDGNLKWLWDLGALFDPAGDHVPDVPADVPRAAAPAHAPAAHLAGRTPRRRRVRGGEGRLRYVRGALHELRRGVRLPRWRDRAAVLGLHQREHPAVRRRGLRGGLLRHSRRASARTCRRRRG